ncbi:helix-turn-helix transcriptional regulator [Methanobacterium sp.]|uniref:helix-turn-helix transcriptional regulator n=1 Tax=Methanobacterium sp. TaxID=2164 RepID=UPI003C775913
MNSKDIYKQYDESRDLLKFLTSSNVRTSILLSLNEGPKNLSDLKQELNLESSTIIHSTSKLEKGHFIFKNGENYTLSQTGKIFALKLVNLIKTIDTIKNHDKLWLNHEIDGIPEDLLLKIGELRNSILIEADSMDIHKPHTNFMQLLENIKKMRGVSPVYHPDFPEIIKILVSNRVEVQLIVTNPILKILNRGILTEIYPKKNFELYVINEHVKEAFTVADDFFSLGLFIVDGIYDYSIDLISDDKDAIAWGEKLFEYYLKKSKKVN